VIAGATVQRDATTGQIRRVRGRIPMPGAQTPAEAAARFLHGNAKVLGLSPTLEELRPERTAESLTGYHVIYQQIYAGMPVFDGELGVHLDRDGAVRLLNQDLIPVSRKITLQRPTDPTAAIAAAVRAVNAVSAPSEAPRAEAGVLVERGVPRSVWRVTFSTHAPGAAWGVMVDAGTNQPISVQNVACYFRAPGEAEK
jgi:Zn-dependent metalloprotease